MNSKSYQMERKINQIEEEKKVIKRNAEEVLAMLREDYGDVLLTTRMEGEGCLYQPIQSMN